jgi:N6-adenosine-specific RNA methylase IME4
MPMTSYVAPGLFDRQDGRHLADWPFGDLQPGAYHLIMADPPWRFELRSERGEEKSAQSHYECMSLEDIAALPVGDLAAPDCLLWLWATAPMLPQQLAVLEAWGFTFKTSGAWVKTTKTGKLAFGTGYVLRNCHEPFLIGTRGRPATAKDCRSIVMAETAEHSRKPYSAYTRAEHLLPGDHIRRVELFSRQSRLGWDTWGNQAGAFDDGGQPERPARAKALEQEGLL